LPLLPLSLAACGGGGSETPVVNPVPVTTAVTDPFAIEVEPFEIESASAVTNSKRAAAARGAANSTTNACGPLDAFYWEIGGPSAKLASGRVGTRYTATSELDIASATKMLSAAYLVETSVPTAAEVPFFNLTSGYVDFQTVGTCGGSRTVAECAAAGNNAVFTPAALGRFSYGGGHLQQLAVQRGMGSWTNETLASEYSRVLGIHVSFINSQLAGGARTSATEYARFMRRVMNNELQLNQWLGSSAVCTQPGVCPSALFSPSRKPMNYSLGHWVEADFDGAYSSAGAFGFYPWIARDRKLYGIVAMQSLLGVSEASLDCGRAIRSAWSAAV
jgi:hypothetical protein